MSERPGSGPPDGPEFGWLYGRPGAGDGTSDGTGGGNAAEPPPDATRRIPVQPRPSTPARPPTPVPASPYPPQPPPQPQPVRRDGGGGRGGGFWARRLRRPGFYVRVVLVLLLLWVAYTVAVPFVTWQGSDQVAFAPDGERPGDQDGTTYLIVGSDSRADLSEEERKRLSTGNNAAELTDTIMLLHTGSGPNVLVSIPRDTEVAGEYGAPNGQINGLYSAGGYPLLVRYLEDSTGIRIDELVEIGLGGVADVVDSVGGIEICPEYRMVDKKAGLNVKKGCQEADGVTALAYSRSRYAQRHGDLDRVKHQREVVAAIGDAVLSPWTVINPVRWWRINDAVPSIFRFGEDTSKLDAGRWALAMSKAGKTCTMPVTGPDAHTWDLDRAKPLFAAIIDDRTDDITRKQCTPTGIAR